MADMSQLYRSAMQLWKEYLRLGPGKTPRAHLEAVELSWQHLQCNDDALPGGIRRAATQVLELSRCCVERPEGLCFVTGEAGLVPRQDLHRAFETALQVLATSDQSASRR